MKHEIRIIIIITSISLFFLIVPTISFLVYLCIRRHKASRDIERAQKEAEDRRLAWASRRSSPENSVSHAASPRSSREAASDASLGVRDPVRRQCACDCNRRLTELLRREALRLKQFHENRRLTAASRRSSPETASDVSLGVTAVQAPALRQCACQSFVDEEFAELEAPVLQRPPPAVVGESGGSSAAGIVLGRDDINPGWSIRPIGQAF